MQREVLSYNSKRVCVALSGGVDSAVAAYLLKQQGYTVVAAFIKVWQPDFLPCSQEADRSAAKRVAASLGIPFYVVDLSEEYKQGIVQYMIDSYTRGETPNPDVACNKVIKFGALWSWAQTHNCDYIATGHHAQIKRNKVQYDISLRGNDVADHAKEPSPQLLRGADEAKDQAYFLWELTNDDLSHILLPIGHMQKSEVRMLAEQAGLPSATRKDSQGLCFLGSLSMHDFLGHLIPPQVGSVYNEKGDIIGSHDGAHAFTFGQRGGFISQSHIPQYVVGIDTANNSITVAPSLEPYKRTQLYLRGVVMRGVHAPNLKAEVRYHGELYTVVHLEMDADRCIVTLDRPLLVAPGQSCVLYDGSVCLGGGIVTKSSE